LRSPTNGANTENTREPDTEEKSPGPQTKAPPKKTKEENPTTEKKDTERPGDQASQSQTLSLWPDDEESEEGHRGNESPRNNVSNKR
jgi:hypothetical protein